MAYISSLKIDKQNNSDNTYFATWTAAKLKVSKKNRLDHYNVTWTYSTGDGVNFSGSSSSDSKSTYSTYSPPDNAISITCGVRAISTKKSNKKSYFTCPIKSVKKKISNVNDPQDDVATPRVSLNNLTLTMSISGITDDNTNYVWFQIYNNNAYYTGVGAWVSRELATVAITVNEGGSYTVRARGENHKNGKTYYKSSGGWSDYSSEVTTKPLAPDGIESLSALSETSVALTWNAVATATSYKVEYATESRYFDASASNVSSVTIESGTRAEITGLESGDEYFFRLAAVNSAGTSAWTAIRSVTLGKAPAAPTTWSSTTTAIVGEKLNLYWVHNSQDNSSQTWAKLELIINGVKSELTIKNEKINDEDHKDDTSVYNKLDTSGYTEGTTIKWRVCTAGILASSFGEWSVQRTIEVYAKPSINLSVTDKNNSPFSTLTSYPIKISTATAPSTQTPVSYYVSITANESYVTVDYTGLNKYVRAGDEVYSKYFDIGTDLSLTLNPGDVNFDPNRSYSINVTGAFDSGLTAEDTSTFNVDWEETIAEPDIKNITIDEDFCSITFMPVCETEDEEPIPGFTLAVYRREFDGEFTLIASDLDSSTYTYVVDPHPRLDSASYRVVAVSNTTGAVSFYDTPGEVIDESNIIIQWNKDPTVTISVSEEDASIDDDVVTSVGTSSVLKLPYNVDVSDSSSVDSELIEYIGRSHPVSYYGTQIGFTSTWNTDVDKEDENTLYMLRKLSRYTGDVYVREPSGSGYWANVNVSFDQKHTELLIPVTFSITRVEGGI